MIGSENSNAIKSHVITGNYVKDINTLLEYITVLESKLEKIESKVKDLEDRTKGIEEKDVFW